MIGLVDQPTASLVATSHKPASTRGVHPISAERERQLAALIRTGDPAAREELVVANLPLVRSIASAFRGQNRVVDLNDLIQEGTLGLMRAASDFDPEAHGKRFVNYAACWIRYRIRRVVAEQATTIRYPYYLVLLRRRFEKAREQMIAASTASDIDAGSTDPGFDDVVERMGVGGRSLRLLHGIRDEIRARPMASIGDPGHDPALARMMPPQEPLEIAESMERLHGAMRKLTLLEAWVLRRRYRLDDSPANASAAGGRRPRRESGPSATPTSGGWRPFRELSNEIGMPVHQIRAIERAALSKLRDILEPRPDDQADRSRSDDLLRLPSRRSA